MKILQIFSKLSHFLLLQFCWYLRIWRLRLAKYCTALGPMLLVKKLSREQTGSPDTRNMIRHTDVTASSFIRQLWRHGAVRKHFWDNGRGRCGRGKRFSSLYSGVCFYCRKPDHFIKYCKLKIVDKSNKNVSRPSLGRSKLTNNIRPIRIRKVDVTIRTSFYQTWFGLAKLQHSIKL